MQNRGRAGVTAHSKTNTESGRHTLVNNVARADLETTPAGCSVCQLGAVEYMYIHTTWPNELTVNMPHGTNSLSYLSVQENHPSSNYGHQLNTNKNATLKTRPSWLNDTLIANWAQIFWRRICSKIHTWRCKKRSCGSRGPVRKLLILQGFSLRYQIIF